MYRPTERGIAFAEGRLSVPSHVDLLCGEVIGFWPDAVDVRDALGDRFSYDELMGKEATP
jgi:hypothetical protein